LTPLATIMNTAKRRYDFNNEEGLPLNIKGDEFKLEDFQINFLKFVLA
jgi:hypothetical protein